MWICPKCKREFKRVNQGHYCGASFKTVLEYIDSQSQDKQSHLIELRKIFINIHQIKEYILWNMPYYEKNGIKLSFSACKKHVSLYVDEEVIDQFKSELKEFIIKKNAIYFPYDKPLPIKLITDILQISFN